MNYEAVPRDLKFVNVLRERRAGDNATWDYDIMVLLCKRRSIHVPKTRFKQINENLRLNVYARMFWEPVYKTSYPYLHNQLRKIGRFTNRFFKFSCESVFTRSVIFHMNCYRAFHLSLSILVHSLEVIR